MSRERCWWTVSASCLCLLTDQSLCKDTFGSSTHLVDDLTGKEQTYAAQD
jgi:hypothetical protein